MVSDNKQVIHTSQKGRAPNKEEAFFLEAAYKNTIESIKSIEDTAKFLVGATATTSGLFLAASKLSLGNDAYPMTEWIAPFTFWAMAIIFDVLVLFPLRYTTEAHFPLAMKKVFERALKAKYLFLSLGAFSFIFGVASAIIIIVQ